MSKLYVTDILEEGEPAHHADRHARATTAATSTTVRQKINVKRQRTNKKQRCDDVASRAASTVSRPRWTEEERRILFQHFGQDITAKSMPFGKQLVEASNKMKTRTIAQIRTQVNNYINGKIKS